MSYDFVWNHCNCPSCVAARKDEKQYKPVLELFKKYGTPDLFNVESKLYCSLSAEQKSELFKQLLKTVNYSGKRCKHCGLPLQQTKTKIKGVCSECIKTLYLECVACKKFIPKDSIEGTWRWARNTRTGKRVLICPECTSTNILVCSGCHSHWYLHTKESLYLRAGFLTAEQVPNSLIKYEKGRRLTPANVRYLNRRYLSGICPVCSENGAVKKCEGCGFLFFSSEIFFTETANGEQELCQSCYERQKLIKEYNWKPARPLYTFAKYETKTEKKLFIGTEIEVEPMRASTVRRTEMAAHTMQRLNPNEYYIKHDGSLHDGWELVTEPWTFYAWQERRDEINSILKFWRENQWWAESGRAGFHMHLSKNAFTTIQLYKYSRFIYNKTNYKFLNKITQRNGNFFHCKLDQIDHIYRAKYKANHEVEHNDDPNGSHHTAFNIDNANTCELRIFRGTVNQNLFWKNWEFPIALFYFTQQAGMKDMRWTKFISWLGTQSMYPYLTKFVNRFPTIKKYL